MTDGVTSCRCLQWLIPAGMDAITLFGQTLIRPADAASPMDLAHEAEHRRQEAKYGLGFALRYVSQPHFRLSSEAMAYARGLAADPEPWDQAERRSVFLELMTTSYRLEPGMTEAEISAAFDSAIAGEELI